MNKKIWIMALLSGLLFTYSCDKDSENPVVESDTEQPSDIPDPDGQDDDSSGDDEDASDSPVEFLNRALVDNNYILINNAASNRVYLINKQGETLYEWPLNSNIGNDVVWLPDERLLASLEAETPKITFGGQGGKLQFTDKDGNVLWNFDYSSEEAETHHDVELLPNGNVITLVWEKRAADVAENAGSDLGIDVYPEAVIEVNPETNEIVWEWHAWDHLIQDHDDTKENYGNVGEHPELIDLNFVPQEDGDIMHANALTYDAVNDVIYISVNFYHEVWVIDHSTTSEEAAGHTGGNFNKGGDLIYRFGNPEAYRNTAGTRLFYNNHYPNLLQGDDLGKMLIYSNGNGLDQSTVYELRLPGSFSLLPDTDNEPEITWSFTHPDLYAPKVSGAVQLPNGNILITEGDFGLWEVTREGEVVWKYSAPGFYWRAYHYNKDAPEIMALGL
ncbi:MAG: aryl-sulfate sulfotransferase [Eudoraea sp.]|nr:aryl-sulfate sulfotransferase [Eudoraea sp.]